MSAFQISFPSFASSRRISTHTNPSGAISCGLPVGVVQCGLSSSDLVPAHKVSAACTSPIAASTASPTSSVIGTCIGADSASVASTCTPPAEPSVNPTVDAGLVAQTSVGGGGCIRSDGAYRLYEVLSRRDLAPSLADRLDYTVHLRVVAARLISAGC